MAEGGVKDKAGEAVTRVKRRVGIENPSAADDDGNVGIVRGALRAFGDGELDQFIDTLKDDVSWEAPKNFPGGESLDGPDEVRDQFLGDVGRTFTAFGFTPEKYLDADDENSVVVFGTFAGEGIEGDDVSEPGVMVWQFSGTEAEHIRVYTDTASFPEIITERVEKEREEEKKRKEEEEKEEKEKEEAKAEEDSDDDSDDSGDSEAKSDDDSEAKSDSDDSSDSEKKSDDDDD